MQSQRLNLGYRGSEYMHKIDRKVRAALDLPLAGLGDPIRTTHGLEVTPHSVSGPDQHEGFPDRYVWTVDIEACSERDGVDVNQYVEADFDVDHSGVLGDDWGGTLDSGECTSGEVRFTSETEDATIRAIRYDITPAITDAYGWLEWDVRDQ